MHKVASPKEIAESLAELWSPRVVGELDDSYVKVAKVHGTFGWHNHEHEDELFFILKGCLRIEMESGPVVLNEGEMFVVPKVSSTIPSQSKNAWSCLSSASQRFTPAMSSMSEHAHWQSSFVPYEHPAG